MMMMMTIKLGGILGICVYTKRFDLCQCQFKITVIFQGQMAARRATTTLGLRQHF